MNSYSFSFDYQIPAKKASEPDLLIFEECSEYQLPGENVLIQSKRTGKRTVVTNEVLYSLKFCDRFRTLEEHVSNLLKHIPNLAGHENDLRRILESVKDAGLIISASEFAANIPAETPKAEPKPETICCILTCDRPQALSRVLNSISENCGTHRDRKWYVIDDSRELENQQQNRSITASFNQTFDTQLIYFGLEEQGEFEQRLVEQLPELDQQIGFLIGRYTRPQIASYGRSRNIALLLSVDRHLICMDDDILYGKLPPPMKKSALSISSRSREVIFYDTPLEWQQDNPPTGDPLQEITGFLGKSLGQAINILGEETLAAESVRELRPGELNRVKPDSRVLVTTCGSYGDPGANTNDWVFSLEKESRERLLTSEAHYELSITQRNLWAGRQSHHFVTGFALISQLTGLDNSSLLPPYFPLYRNEDLLFGEMMQVAYPEAMVLEFPWAVEHFPLDQRKWNRDGVSKSISYDFSGFTADYMANSTSSIQSDNPVSRYRVIAQQLLDLSTITDSRLNSLIEAQTLTARTSQARYCSHILEEEASAPEFWKNDVKKAIASNQEGALRPVDTAFKFPGESDSKSSVDHAKNYWRDFALCINAWPDIRKAAKEIIN